MAVMLLNQVYPDAQIQRCVIHMLRNFLKYVYNAPNEIAAFQVTDVMSVDFYFCKTGGIGFYGMTC